MKPLIILPGYPMPPQSNNLFANSYKGGRRRSREYNIYRGLVAQWEFLNRQKIIRCIETLKVWAREPLALIRVHTYFGFEESKILTKPHKITGARKLKKLDASNRIKACHDTLSEIIGIDDLRFSCGEVDKCLSDKNEVLIVLEPSKLRRLEEMKKGWGLKEKTPERR